MLNFSEWVKRKDVAKPRPKSIKNKDMDTLLKSVDGLKRDLEELDALEKKDKKVKLDKSKKVPVPTKDDDETEGDEAEGDDPVDDPDVDGDSDDKPVRRVVDPKVPVQPPGGRGEPRRPDDPRIGRVGRK